MIRLFWVITEHELFYFKTFSVEYICLICKAVVVRSRVIVAIQIVLFSFMLLFHACYICFALLGSCHACSEVLIYSYRTTLLACCIFWFLSDFCILFCFCFAFLHLLDLPI